MMQNSSVTDDDIADLVRRVDEANLLLLRGDIRAYLELIQHPDDYTLMSPFGGVVRGFDTSPENLERMSRFFKGGQGTVELEQAYASGDLVVLVFIERQRAEVDDIPEQEWSLRVTAVFRREDSEWWLVHRHADSIVNDISVEQAAAIARG